MGDVNLLCWNMPFGVTVFVAFTLLLNLSVVLFTVIVNGILALSPMWSHILLLSDYKKLVLVA